MSGSTRHGLGIAQPFRPLLRHTDIQTRVRYTRVRFADRLLWVWLSQLWSGWRSALMIVKPETVIAWHRRGLRLYWSRKSRHPPGRPSLSAEVIARISKMSQANHRAGAPRMHGELLKLGFPRNLAHVSGKPYEGYGLLRLLRGSDRFVGNRGETGDHHAQAYASTRGSAPALNTPVFISTMIPALDESDQGGVTRSL